METHTPLINRYPKHLINIVEWLIKKKMKKYFHILVQFSLKYNILHYASALEY